MKAHRLVITFAAVASLAALSGVGADATNGSPDWRDALHARSAALNERYGLGEDAGRRTLGVPVPSWLDALTARSDAMNRGHGLGKYARQAARTSSTPDWLAALNTHGDALNRQYGLGGYAPKR